MNNEILIVVSVIIVFVLALVITWFITKQNYEKKLNKLNFEANLEQSSLNNALNSQKDLYLQELNNQNILHTSKLSEAELKNSTLEEKLDFMQNSFEEKLALLEESKKQMKVEFENLANKIFEENSKKSNTNFEHVLKPFKEQLEGFGKRVNDIYSEETKQRTSLLGEIKNLKELNNQISSDALNLTKALKGENKTQGDWGEMILSKILEQTGLREGREYSTQGSYTSEDGKRLRPDVIVHLPQNKDVVIDSKVSLVSYTNYIESSNEDEKQKYTKELIKSIYAHIKGLSSKKYEDIKDVNSLDFVLLFIPLEGAFMLAASNDNHLFKTAFEHNIMLVSPSTLFVTLRTIENIWRYEHQNENALVISKKAADLYDKFAAFVKDIEDIGTNLNRTSKAYDSAVNKLSSGKGNLIRRSEEFIELGVKAKKKIDTNKLLD